MRTATINDYWNRLETKKDEFKIQLKNLDINNLGMLENNRIDFEGQLIAICGKNGVGKSTLLSSIIALLNPTYYFSSSVRQKKIDAASFTMGISHLGEEYSIQFPKDLIKLDGTVELEQIEEKFSTAIVDTSSECIELLNYFTQQKNLQDLIDPAPRRDLKDKELKELGFILNKEITKCIIYQIEIDEEKELPYFQIEYRNQTYGTELLGLGEIAAIYIYSTLKNIKKDTFLIIEEPETYLSYQAQENLINVLARYTVDKKLCTIITSHSHAIINKIPSRNTVYISRTGNKSNAKNASNKYRTLKYLGMPLTIPRVFCVEDSVSRSYTTNLLDRYHFNSIYDYIVVPVDGVENVNNALSLPNLSVIQTEIIGVFDGDQRGKVTRRFNRPHIFLPGSKSPENQFKDAILTDLESAARTLGISRDRIEDIMTDLEGLNEHDWFIELCKSLTIQQDIFIDKMIDILITQDNTIFKEFSDEVESVFS